MKLPLSGVLAVASLCGSLAVTGCGAGSAPSADPVAPVPTGTAAASSAPASGASASGGPARTLEVSAAFYPLQWITSRVGGDRVDVTSLAKPGAEPHDLELGPRDVAALRGADLVVYLRGFQPAVDEAVTQQAADSALDTADAARLDLRYVPLEHGHEGEAPAGGEEQGEEHEEPEEHGDEERTDPHFWLDPTRAAAVGDAVADRLAGIDGAGVDTYRANAAALRRDLEGLDAEIKSGTRSCASKQLVTSHNAFGYLAQRYGFRQLGISGLSPEDEPSARELSEVSKFVRDNTVRTIYHETLVSPDIANTVAAETGARTAVLDPLEGLGDASAGRDYLEVMRSNLASLRQGQSCS